MSQLTWIPTCFVRGGTSKGLYFRASDLPARELWDPIFCAAMGSPDPNERQLDGMGGGISSLSKVMVVAPSARPGSDLEYTFGQVDVASATVDYSANCGNLSSGVVPFALESGLITSPDGHHEFRLYNTNTAKSVITRLEVSGGRAAVAGGFRLPGVSGTGAPIELVYPSPAGSRTSGLLPTENAVDRIAGIDASLVDACLAMAFIRARDVGLTATELPTDIDAQAETMARLEEIRRAAAVAMGMADSPDNAPAAAPKIALVAPAAKAPLLCATTLAVTDADLNVRVLSMGKAHKAVPGTGAMCLAAAATVPGTLVTEAIGKPVTGRPLRIGTPSGAVAAAAAVAPDAATHDVAETSLLRTARILMRGEVAVPPL